MCPPSGRYKQRQENVISDLYIRIIKFIKFITNSTCTTDLERPERNLLGAIDTAC